MDSVDTTRMEEMLNDIAVHLGAAANEILKNEASLFITEIMNKTPPTPYKTVDQNNKTIKVNGRRSGELAITNDLSKVFTQVQQGFLDRIGSEYGTRDINQWITSKTGQKENLRWKRLSANGEGMSQFHQSVRGSRGRVPKGFKGNDRNSLQWTAKFVVSQEDYLTYKAKVQARVGLMKSSWLAGLTAANPVRAARVPAWIRRHGAKAGTANNHLNDATKPFITITSFAPGVRQITHFVHQAIKTREVALARRLRAAIDGVNLDVAAGRRVGKIKVAND